MKKTIVFLISLLMMMNLAACGNSSSQADSASTEKNL